MDKELFITDIHIYAVRNLPQFHIPLGKEQRKHLILTGRNGSGKTTLLQSIKTVLDRLQNGDVLSNYVGHAENLKNWQGELLRIQQLNQPEHDERLIQTSKEVLKIKDMLGAYGGLELVFSSTSTFASTETQAGRWLPVYFEAKRSTAFQIPQGVSKVDLKPKYDLTEKAGNFLLQYIVNLKAERSFAKDDGDQSAASEIDAWFERFESSLRDIFEAPSLTLVFDRKNFNFRIHIDGKEPCGFDQLSDGHAAIFSILTELILRMEAQGNRAYDMQGVVLVDEIETHLHVSLQKKILPFLCKLFPRMQFIVTTHSPFVISSVSNAVICDLQNNIITEDLSGYSYDALIESYFMSDKYSELLKRQLQRFEDLIQHRTADDLDEYLELKAHLFSLPKFHAPELEVKLQQLKLQLLGTAGDK